MPCFENFFFIKVLARILRKILDKDQGTPKVLDPINAYFSLV
jgi:hypothetical protein